MSNAEVLRGGPVINREPKHHNHLALKIAAATTAVATGVAGAGIWAELNFGKGNGGENNNAITTSQSSSAKESSTASSKVESAISNSKVETIDKELALAPDLAGAKKVLQDNGMGSEVTYVAESGNQYGVEANKFLGVYRENVTLENEKVGGVALIPSVVNKLVNDKLNTLTDDQGKWTVFVPADISEIKDKDAKINMNIGCTAPTHPNNTVDVSFDGAKVSISSLSLYGGIFTTKFGIDQNQTKIRLMGAYVAPGVEVNKIQEKYFNIFLDDARSDIKNISSPDDKTPFGANLGSTNDSIKLAFYSNVAGATYEIDNSKILTVDKSPVFVIDQ